MKNLSAVLLLSLSVLSCASPNVTRFVIQAQPEFEPVKCIQTTQPASYKTHCTNVYVDNKCFIDKRGTKTCGPASVEVCVDVLQQPEVSTRCNDKLWNKVKFRREYNDF